MKELNDKAAGKIAKLILRLQVRYAKLMSEVVAKLSVRQLKLLLILCCIVTGGFSLWLMLQAVFIPATIEHTMKVDKMKVPVYIDREEGEFQGMKLDTGLIRKIKQQQRIMDSMGIEVSEGLTDSIQLLINQK
jgi:hypothetical protein